MEKNVATMEEMAEKEFIDVVSEYMVSLLDPRGNLELKCEKKDFVGNELVEYVEDDRKRRFIYFYPCEGTDESPAPFRCKVGTYSSKSIVKPAKIILSELLKVTEYGYKEKRIFVKRHYGKEKTRQVAYKKRMLGLAFELGMCQTLVPKYEDSETLYAIVCCLMKWAGRTYEGKKVPFGILIDFEKEASANAADYLHFLENDNSAVFTDGMFTGVLLDKKGRAISFLTSVNKNNESNQKEKVFVPYQFEALARHCTGATVGIFVLENGEILLVKNRALKFAKRGNKWLRFDWSRVYSGLRPFFLCDENENEESVERKIKELYCTLLDVSFAHCGGCIGLVVPNREEELEKTVKERIDWFLKGEEIKGLSKESHEKIKVLTYLLSAATKEMPSFFDVDEPVRKELLSLDGATVIALDGQFFCTGSIVTINGGSSGGGRTKAANDLAKYGVGIKISEDGYIEAYGLEDPEDKNNSKTVPLFKFK